MSQTLRQRLLLSLRMTAWVRRLSPDLQAGFVSRWQRALLSAQRVAPGAELLARPGANSPSAC
ncbi:hypothetical protein [Chromobacterium sphagni]|uniref:hypothetical protein n=1 Tax=Chromobacterium sphagni TaxID=1903179 RepID=UPI0011135569|nr:hypothetical protein [Chromobacterium sphagni]